jgi:hypothetical protein
MASTVAVLLSVGCGPVVQWRSVEEGSATGRVEIELTSREGRRGGGRGRRRTTDVLDPLSAPAAPIATPRFGSPASGDDDTAYAPPETDGGPTSDRRRLIVTAAASAVVALFVGWSLGRATSGDDRHAGDVATGSTTVTATLASVPPELVGATVAPVDPSLLPATSAFSPIVGRGGPPVSTPVVGWITTTAQLAPAATHLGVNVVGLEPGGKVVELDTATGEMSSIETDVPTNYPGALYARNDWILVTQPDSARAELLRGHSDQQQVMLAPAWALYWQPGTDHFWRLDEVSRFGDPLHIQEVSYDGTPTGVEFESDGRYWMAGADPLGGLLILGAPGGSYRITPDGTSRITTGDVIALSAEKVLATDCGEAMSDCGLTVIDRATGASTPLTPTIAAPETSTPQFQVYDNPANYGFPAMISAMSPDGRYSPIMVVDTDQDYGVIDLTTGEFIRFGNQPESSLWWSPDSRSAMYLDNGHLTVYDFDTRSTYEVSPDVFPLQDLVVRPLVH